VTSGQPSLVPLSHHRNSTMFRIRVHSLGCRRRNRIEISVPLPTLSIGIVLQSIIMNQTLDTPVLERMLEPVTRSLNADAAKKLVRLKADAKVQARVAKLARKCNEGELTPEEAAEYDRYIAYADVVAILQAKARLLLAKKP